MSAADPSAPLVDARREGEERELGQDECCDLGSGYVRPELRRRDDTGLTLGEPEAVVSRVQRGDDDERHDQARQPERRREPARLERPPPLEQHRRDGARQHEQDGRPGHPERDGTQQCRAQQQRPPHVAACRAGGGRGMSGSGHGRVLRVEVALCVGR